MSGQALFEHIKYICLTGRHVQEEDRFYRTA